MKKLIVLSALLLIVINPTNQALAQSNKYAVGDLSTLQGFLISIGFFINDVIIPLMFGIALLFFLTNSVRYFIIGGDNEGDREKARRLALYGIAGFVILVSIWGIVNMFTAGLEIDQSNSICPDYLGDWCNNGGTNKNRFNPYFKSF